MPSQDIQLPAMPTAGLACSTALSAGHPDCCSFSDCFLYVNALRSALASHRTHQSVTSFLESLYVSSAGILCLGANIEQCD